MKTNFSTRLYSTRLYSTRLYSTRLYSTRLYSTRSIPFALLLACFLAYGPLIPWLGFYWDDWPTLWFLNRFGPGIFKAAYGIDRPALGWLFTATTALVGQSPLAWQIFGIVTHWLACLSLWWMLRAVWPGRTMEVTWAAFLFALYPGFMQHPIAFTYSADWIAISLFFFSFWLMVSAHRQPKWGLLMMVLSLLLAAYVMFADEYYFGLELLRPVFLWLAFSEQIMSARRRLRQVALRWLPYLAMMAIFLYWRLVIFVSPRGQLQIFDQLAEQPVGALTSLAGKVLGDLFQSSLGAWAQALDFRLMRTLQWLSLLAYLVLTILTALLAIYYFKNLRLNQEQAVTFDPAARKTWARQASLIGVYALLVGGWPFWVTNLPIELYFPWDRFNLAMMFGASLALAGGVVWIARTALQKALVFGILTGLAVGFHFYNANLYRQDWNLQKSFFWQLAWRAPGLQPGTLVLTSDLPFKYYSDNSLTAPLNLIYARENHTLQLPYMFYNIESRLGARLADFKNGLPVEQPYRIATFSGNTSNTIVLFYDPPRCVKIIDPATDLLLPRKPDYIAEAIPLSNLGLIQSDPPPPARPPQAFFGTEPVPDWCYYFQKAELARQLGDWTEVARLGDRALDLPTEITREKASELIPYLQGYLHLGQWEKSLKLTRRAFEADAKMANMLCPIWYDIHQSATASMDSQDAFQQVTEMLSCNYSVE
jgi:hypothetical protein